MTRDTSSTSSKTGAARPDDDKELVDIKSVVSSAVEQARPLIETRRHALTVRMDASQATVLDRTRIGATLP